MLALLLIAAPLVATAESHPRGVRYTWTEGIAVHSLDCRFDARVEQRISGYEGVGTRWFAYMCSSGAAIAPEAILVHDGQPVWASCRRRSDGAQAIVASFAFAAPRGVPAVERDCRDWITAMTPRPSIPEPVAFPLTTPWPRALGDVGLKTLEVAGGIAGAILELLSHAD